MCIRDRYDTIGARGDWYIITAGKENARILFFNRDADNSQDMEFNIFNMLGR